MPITGKPWYRILYIQVLISVVLGICVGILFPDTGKMLKPLADAFIKMVKMIIAPIIFCTVVHGIASMGDMKKLGRVGFKTLLYFEIVSTLALLIGLVVVNILKPGEGFNIDPATLDSSLTSGYVEKAKSHSMLDFFLNIIPTTIFSPFTNGDLLQVLFISILMAFTISFMGEKKPIILNVLETASKLFFGVMGIVVKFAPLGAFGAMGFTVGSYGLGALGKLLELMIGFYITSALFIFIVLGSISWFAGFSIFRYLSFIKEELLLVLGTSSSETALPGMMEKSIKLGCSPSTVGLVIPSGYSFNLDGTNIYLCMAAVFLAQATNTQLDLGQQITLLLVAMISSKGSSGVTGAGFITLAATLATVPSIPIESLSLLIGIDRFMSECRAITNLIGNGVATVVISRWEGEVTKEQLNECLQK
ncbi:MAG: C4-dicarboxylate transport protein [Planctomycetota bacterium]|jgi:aerobic C4-dicarboxylate transport protein